MTNQPDLFDVGERIEPLEPAQNTGRKKPPCTPAPVGSGPAETCKTCKHKYQTSGTANRYLKCGLMRAVWTKGPGTDIKASWPACRMWESAE